MEISSLSYQQIYGDIYIVSFIYMTACEITLPGMIIIGGISHVDSSGETGLPWSWMRFTSAQNVQLILCWSVQGTVGFTYFVL